MLHRFKLSVSRCCYGRHVFEHHFWQCDGYTTHVYVFWDADSERDMEKFEFEEKLTTREIWNFYNCNGDQFFNDNFNKKWSYRLEMTKGFHIWSQNLNRTAIDPLFGQKTVKNEVLPVFTVFGQKGGLLFDLNFRTRFELLSSFSLYMTPFC